MVVIEMEVGVQDEREGQGRNKVGKVVTKEW